MEDDKLAAYYDELTQKGGGAARFKQGLGFSSTTPANNTVPPRGSALPSTSSFLSSFVKASSPTTSSSFHKQAQLESIQNKLNKAPNVKPPNQDKNSRSSSRRSRSRSRSRSPDRDKTRDRHSRRRSRSQSRSPVRYSRRRSRSRSQSPNGYSRHRHRSRDRRARRRSRSREDYGSRRKHQSRSRSRERERERSKRRSRSWSPGQRMEKGRKRGEKKNGVGGGGRVDYTKLIEGYDKMTPAERVKAKMELQLSKTGNYPNFSFALPLCIWLQNVMHKNSCRTSQISSNFWEKGAKIFKSWALAGMFIGCCLELTKERVKAERQIDRVREKECWRFKFEHSGGGEVLFSNCTIEVSAQLTDVDCICRNRCKSFKNFGNLMLVPSSHIFLYMALRAIILLCPVMAAVEDDAALVKHLGQSFRFSAVEAKKEEDIKAAHDEAMFGASSLPLNADTDNEEEEDNNTEEENGSSPVKSLLSNQVLTMQQGSWRDRAHKG
ncbi:uncharacterized protein LOC111374130 [Olea europaea var. sylvestris]|uniref:uncharacterized protein LOC111374130 n=1 Tax=Olea europaea var. sylvestris TaxID=158386 RepID=UPI000C1D59B6|nr:uncharacterized protein LOC111374130 [Olea europaea var. sylvestris]